MSKRNKRELRFIRASVAELRLLMKKCGQSYHFMALHYGHHVPPTNRGVSKTEKNSIIDHALRTEIKRLTSAGGWPSGATRAVAHWIETFKPNLLESLALAADA